MRDADQEFRESIRDIRYAGIHISDITHEGISICGRVTLRDLEAIVEVYRKWIDATIYKSEKE